MHRLMPDARKKDRALSPYPVGRSKPHIGLLAAVFAATACTATVAPRISASYRDAAKPIYSNAQLDPARLVGRWAQVADFGPEADACKPGGVDIMAAGSGLKLTYRLCQSGVDIRGAGAMTPAGPGRFAVQNQPGPWWVLWADVDYRTLVIGTPSGQIGFILNRDGALPADRLAAAREILDWNGYDLTQLQRLR